MAAWVYGAVAGLQLLNGLNQASLIRQQAELNKQIADMNIELAQIDQFEAIADGMTQEARYQTVIDTVRAQQEAVFAARNVNSDFGTAADIVQETELNGFLNKLDIQNAAFSKAAGIEREIRGMRVQSFMAQQQAEINATATTQVAAIEAVSTGLSGYAKSNAKTNPNTSSTTSGPGISYSRNSYLGGTSEGDALGYLGVQR